MGKSGGLTLSFIKPWWNGSHWLDLFYFSSKKTPAFSSPYILQKEVFASGEVTLQYLNALKIENS